MNNDMSWTARTGNDPLPFALARLAAKELLNFMTRVANADIIPPAHDSAMAKEYQALLGNTTSGSLFAALDHLTPDLVTTTEQQWFRRVAAYYRKVARLALGGDPDDDKPITSPELTSLDGPRLSIFSQASRNADTIDRYLSPERER